MGEGQILAQVKQVYKVGQDCPGFGRHLTGLFKQVCWLSGFRVWGHLKSRPQSSWTEQLVMRDAWLRVVQRWITTPNSRFSTMDWTTGSSSLHGVCTGDLVL